MKNFSRSGFTLIELMVVVAIIAILSVIGLVSFQGAAKSSRDGKRKADLSQVRAALELYRSQFPAYPTYAGPSNASYNSMTGDLKTAQYLSDPLPVDPKNAAPNQYTYSSNGSTYCLCANLENGNGGFTSTSCAAGAGAFYCVQNP